MMRSSILDASMMLNILIQHLPLQSLSWTNFGKLFEPQIPAARPESKSLASTIAEFMWIPSLMKEIQLPTSMCAALWYLDATYLEKNMVLHARIKHVEIDLPFV